MNFAALLLVYIITETFELFYVQRGSTSRAYIANLAHLYERGVMAFLCMHPSFYVVLLCAVASGRWGLLTLTLVGLKAADIALKLTLLKRLFGEEELGVFAPLVEQDVPIGILMKVLMSGSYVVIFYAAFAPWT
jgi:hypothetical protein